LNPSELTDSEQQAVEWENSSLLGPDLAGELTRMKAQPGKDIAVSGSVTGRDGRVRAGQDHRALAPVRPARHDAPARAAP